MKQRKKQPVQTRKAILEAAGEQFARGGYAGTGLAAITARAGLTKGALFHHFQDKLHLALAWVGDSLTTSMETDWFVPLAAIGSLDDLAHLGRSRCLDLGPQDAGSTLVLLCAETAMSEPALAQALGGVMSAWRDALAGAIRRGTSEGWIHRSIRPETEAAFLVSTFSGFTVTTKVDQRDGFRRECASSLNAYFETLRPQ